MRGHKVDVVRGGGNVFRDLGHENADVEQFKAILAAEIIKVLDRESTYVCRARVAPGSRRPTSRASAMRSSGGSRWIDSCQSSTGSGPGWK